MGLVAQWRWSGLAITLVLVLASAVACSDRKKGLRQGPVGAGAGGADAGDDTSSGAGGASGQSAGGSAGAAGTGEFSGTGGGNAGTTGGSAPQQDGSVPLDASEQDATVAEPLGESCLQELSNFTERGPFEFTATEWEKENDVGRIKAWIPDVPAGCHVPMVHFANGTAAPCGMYRSTLEQLASFGFLALCFDSTNTGEGTQCIEAVEMAASKLPELISGKVGFAGHDTGGMAAFMCLYHAKEDWNVQPVLAGYALTPAHGSGGSGNPPWTEAYGFVDAPVLMISTEGGLISEEWIGDAFDYVPATTELYQYKAVGVPDIPIAFEPMNESIVPWFRWKLLGDRAACEYFKAMPDTDAWNLIHAVNAADCDAGEAIARIRSE